MSPFLRRSLPVPALLVALALSACGTSSDTKAANAYVGEVNGIQNTVAAQFRQAGAALAPTSSLTEDRKALGQFEQAITTAVAKFKAVKAPKKVAALHQDLIDEVGSYQQTIATARKALGGNTADALARAQSAFATGTAQTSNAITTTISEINRKLHE